MDSDVHPTDPNIVYAGAAAGGIWKTTNGGTTWSDKRWLNWAVHLVPLRSIPIIQIQFMLEQEKLFGFIILLLMREMDFINRVMVEIIGHK